VKVGLFSLLILIYDFEVSRFVKSLRARIFFLKFMKK